MINMEKKALRDKHRDKMQVEDMVSMQTIFLINSLVEEWVAVANEVVVDINSSTSSFISAVTEAIMVTINNNSNNNPQKIYSKTLRSLS